MHRMRHRPGVAAGGDGPVDEIDRHRQLAVLATLAVLADAVTTAAFLDAGAGSEQNGLLVAGLEFGLSGGALVFLLTQGLLLAVAWRSFGAVSTYVAAYLVVAMGLGGGLNNAVLLLTGQALLAPLGPASTYLAPPVAATVVGTVAVGRLHRDPRWGLVGPVAAVLLTGEIVSFVG